MLLFVLLRDVVLALPFVCVLLMFRFTWVVGVVAVDGCVAAVVVYCVCHVVIVIDCRRVVVCVVVGVCVFGVWGVCMR